MRNFDIKKAWPVAVATAGLAMVGQAQANTSGLPVSGLYTASLIGSGTAYFLQLGQHINYTPAAAGVAATASLSISTTSGLISVDLKASSTASTWGFALGATNNSVGAANGTVTMSSTWSASTTTTCTVTYELTQDFGSQVLTLQNATVSSVALTSGKPTTSTDTTTCNTAFNGRTGLIMAQNPAKTINYTLIY